MAELFALGASELLRGYRQRDFSPVDVMQSVLARIAHWEPHLCATYLLRPEQALAQARASEARWQRGQPCGVLDGVPMTLKDNVATAGDPWPLGTAATPLTPALRDAPPAARLHEAGAVLACKTTMPDYGMLSSGLSSFHPLARNPWTCAKPQGDRVPVQAPQRRPGTGLCMSAPISEAPCACRLDGAAFSASNPAWAASRSTRPTPAAWLAR